MEFAEVLLCLWAPGKHGSESLKQHLGKDSCVRETNAIIHLMV